MKTTRFGAGNLLKITDFGGDQWIAFVCPACSYYHTVEVGGERSVWTWDGNERSPTFSPSVLATDPGKVCHCFIRAGMIEYLADCTHDMAGQTVPMREFPGSYRQEFLDRLGRLPAGRSLFSSPPFRATKTGEGRKGA